MQRTVTFIEPTEYQSRAGSKYIETAGVSITHSGRRSDRPDDADIEVHPVGVRGQPVEGCRVVLHSEALGEVAETLFEMWSKHATPEAMRGLLARMEAIVRTREPENADGDEPADPRPRP
ncbi:MAG: hypothetical protein JSS43_20485 [Proteobacteria bacterium]|nr:hypothetical protein [Pseudomonadota bacterium]